MAARLLGQTGLAIEPLVLGGNVFGWTVDQPTSCAILDAFVDAGFNAIDTADVYSGWVPGHRGGESESAIGQWLHARGGRDRLVLASKVGERMPGLGGGLSPDHIIRSVEGSLRRLRTDYLDLYQSHVDDRSIPLEVTLEAYERLRRTGKIRAVGASHHSAARLVEALAVGERPGTTRYQTVQPRYNLFDRDEFEGPLQDLCLDRELGVLCYSTLAKGFLAGRAALDGVLRYGHGRSLIEQRYLNDRGLRILDALDAVAAEQEAKPTEIALAWVAAQPGVTAPIVGVETVEQLRELTGFGRIVLEPVQVARLSAAVALDPVR